MSDVKRAAIYVGVIRIVEPEPHMKRVDRVGIGQVIGIEAEDLFKQDGLDRRADLAFTVGLKIGLIPGKTEVLEVRIQGAVRQGCCARR